MTIWILDCSNGCVTKVNLSEEKEKEMNHFLDDENGDMWDYIYSHGDDFGINPNSSSYMVTDNEHVYEVDY